MDFTLSPEQQQIVTAIERLCLPFDADYWLAKDTDGGFPHDFHRALADAGWLGIAMPTACASDHQRRLLTRNRSSTPA